MLGDADAGELQVVVTESIFSMDGDAADLEGLARLKQQRPFVLLMDEAHDLGTGHLRQHERVTLADRGAEARDRALHIGPTPPTVLHLIAVREAETTTARADH